MARRWLRKHNFYQGRDHPMGNMIPGILVSSGPPVTWGQAIFIVALFLLLRSVCQ